MFLANEPCTTCSSKGACHLCWGILWLWHATCRTASHNGEKNWELHRPHQRTPSQEIKRLHKPWQSEPQVLKNVPSKHMSQVHFSLCQRRVLLWLWRVAQVPATASFKVESKTLFYTWCSGILCYRGVRVSGRISISHTSSSQDQVLTRQKKDHKGSAITVNLFFLKH